MNAVTLCDTSRTRQPFSYKRKICIKQLKMGNSPPIAEDDDDFAEFDGIETLGYRVLGVQPQSPASKAGLVSFFDFIVGANEEMLLGSGENLEEGEEYNDIDCK
jgi:hypothetical protein